ncbi:efflux RND transporter periplasmic adaptor subunit [Saccharospirillum salsuginis]|uniref:Multidrug resistance protein MdtA-like barrel-sandwich hybrid domain-containing protein n=1 Tax=Saccharospirillum salsuginis TaxID=418750 RepID=A0A918KRR8_9GAMM|nr:biotin/lipoyl-binding protein [Saccharospirillum salsuginis]GGX73485.1 hypothetical protein GCM10007392_46160 [Saccharospirillum salsuginis]
MKTWTTLLVSGVILAAAGTAVGVMMNQTPAPEKAEAEEARWEIESVRAESDFYRPEIRLVGQVVARREQQLTTPLSSEVLAIPAKEGQRVAQGDVLVELDDFDTSQQLRQVEADLQELSARLTIQRQQHRMDEQALTVEKAKLERLKDRLQQQQRLVDRGLSPQQQADDLQQQVEQQQLSVLQHQTQVENQPAQLAQLEASLQKLELSLAQAERRQAETQVTAPFSGRIARLGVQLGQTTQPGQSLLTLYSDQAMQMKVQLPHFLAGNESDLGAHASQNGRTTELRFDRAEASLGTSQSGVTAWFDLVDGEGWLPGGYARLTVQQPAVYSYRVPESAVFQDNWLYGVTGEGRLKALSIEVLGVNQDGDQRWLIVRGPDLSGELRVMTTRLNNPVTGMRVYEPGVDPDPELATDEAPAETES